MSTTITTTPTITTPPRSEPISRQEKRRGSFEDDKDALLGTVNEAESDKPAGPKPVPAKATAARIVRAGWPEASSSLSTKKAPGWPEQSSSLSITKPTGLPETPSVPSNTKRLAGWPESQTSLSSGKRPLSPPKSPIEEGEAAEPVNNTNKSVRIGSDVSATDQRNAQAAADMPPPERVRQLLQKPIRKPNRMSLQLNSIPNGLPPKPTQPANSRPRPQSWQPSPVSQPSQFYQTPPVSSRPQSPAVSGLMDSKAIPNSHRNILPGHIIYVPHHVTALQPGADPETDPNFTQSSVATICSKRRMMIVLWTYSTFVFGLPLFSQSKRGLQDMPSSQLREFVCIKELDNFNFNNKGMHQPLEGKKTSGAPLGECTNLQLTNGYTVNLLEDIKVVGYITQESVARLYELWLDEVEQARRIGSYYLELERETQNQFRQKHRVR